MSFIAYTSIINNYCTTIFSKYDWTRWHRLKITCLHDLNQGQNLVHVLARGHKTLQHEDLEVLKHVTAQSSHHLHHAQGKQ